MEPRCSKDNRVIIRVWDALPYSPQKSFGHISIETTSPPSYMSLWPAKGSPENWQMIIKADSKTNADEDIAQEKRLPEKIICLYSLKSKKIVDKFKKITDDPQFKGWTLIGNNKLINGGNAHSCASLAYILLREGEIYNLISPAHSSRSGVSMSAMPSVIAELAIAAKKQELTYYPEIRSFSFERKVEAPRVHPQRGVEYICGVEQETKSTPKNCHTFFKENYKKITVMSSLIIGAAAVIYKCM